MNETIKSVMCLVSNAVIVLTSRELLIELIKMNSSLQQASRVAACIPPSPPRPATFAHHEFELLQILDVLYHTVDSLATYKTILRSLLLSPPSSSSSRSMIVSRMACANMMPEFKLVKRESWTSEEKRDRDRGRVHRMRSSGGASNSAIVEDAVQFASTNGGGGVAANYGIQLTNFLRPQHQPQLVCLTDSLDLPSGGGGGGLETGYKPNDIERLTNPDSSNLLVIFDLNKPSSAPPTNTATTNKSLPINVEFFKKYSFGFISSVFVVVVVVK